MSTAVDDAADGPRLAVGSGEGPPLEAIGLASGSGAQAILVRDGDRPRLLVSAERVAGQERLVISPLDVSHEVRRDADALAEWIGRAPITSRGVARVPSWANLLGFAIVIAVVALTLLGTLTLVTWLGDVTGLAR